MNFNKQQVLGVVIILFGISFLFNQLFDFNLLQLIFRLWPLLFIYFGYQIIQREKSKKSENPEVQQTAGSESSSSDQGYDDFSFIGPFGDKSARLNSKDFQGGSASVFIGSLHINMTDIDFKEGEKIIKINTVIGDVYLTLPQNIAYKIKSNTIIGGVKTFENVNEGLLISDFYRSDGYSEQKKKLFIEVSTIIGEIKIV